MLSEALAVMYGVVHAPASLSLVNMQVPGEEQMAKPSPPPTGGRRRRGHARAEGNKNTAQPTKRAS